MNRFNINDEYGYKDYKYLNKIINKTLELENIHSSFFEITFIDNEKIREINRIYRHVDRETDVISFAFEDDGNICYNERELGEIYISIPKMKSQAQDYGHSEKRELAFLVVHGLLHLLGYDHVNNKEEEKIMFGKQEMILNEFEETKKNS